MAHFLVLQTDSLATFYFNDIPAHEFVKAPPGLPGYTAQSRVFIGGGGLGVLFDTGASCMGLREEEALEILNIASQRVARGELTINSPDYPLKRLELLTTKENLTGLAAQAILPKRHSSAHPRARGGHGN